MPTTPIHVDSALREAQVLTHEYDQYDTDAAFDRLGAGAPVRTAGRVGARRPLSRTEQAARDLDLASALIVDAPQAATSLSRLIDHDRIDPAGALVFAALLHLAGYADGAEFWWRFAAGAGDSTAAFCLFLFHERQAEFRDARFWRDQSKALVGADQLPRNSLRWWHFGGWRLRRWRRASVLPQLLPEYIRSDLLARCHQGDRPRLPPRVQALIHSLSVEADDEDFGEIPRPDHSLAALHQHHSTSRLWMRGPAIRRSWSRVVIRVRI